MKSECPECNVTVSLDEFPNFPAEHICDECGACFELESNLIFEADKTGELIGVLLRD